MNSVYLLVYPLDKDPASESESEKLTGMGRVLVKEWDKGELLVTSVQLL